MNYMKDSRKIRHKPHEHFQMKSILVFTESYLPKTESYLPKQERRRTVFKHLKIAHYAKQKDYHIWFKQRLSDYIKDLKKEFPGESFLAFTDAVPLLERDYGRQAGLGWVGKNSCLIHPKRGSFFFIGEILSSLEIHQRPKGIHDLCGNCTACMDGCPTGAIVEEKILDANLCISYWNIESKGIPPVEIRQKMGSWFFGCDVCQNLCPWNIKIHQNLLEEEIPSGELIESPDQARGTLPDSHIEKISVSRSSKGNTSKKSLQKILRPENPWTKKNPEKTKVFQNPTGNNRKELYEKESHGKVKETHEKALEEELRFILESSNKKLMRFLKDSPLTRAGGRGLKRNALIVIANRKFINLRDLVETFSNHETLGELAQWTLEQLNHNPS